MVNPPVPPIAPLYVPDALVKVNVFEPNIVVPLPDRDWMDVPEVVPLISNVPLLATLLLVAIDPLPDNAIVEPKAIDVVPV